MAENLLEQLDQRIQRQEKVTALDVADAYSQTVDNRRKEYVGKGGKFENFELEEKAFLEGAKELRNKQLERIGVQGAEYEKKQQATIDAAKEKERGVKFDASLKYSRDVSLKSGGIDDYDGMGDSNDWGFGRMTFSGYMASLQSMDPRAAQREYDKAFAAFKQAGKDSTWGDECLLDDDIKKIIGHENLNSLEGFDLAHESKAFLAGYLRYSETYFKDANVTKAYKDYVIGKLTELKNQGKVTVTPEALSQKINSVPTDYNRTLDVKKEDFKGRLQIEKFVSILNPQEWQQYWRETLQKVYDPFKKSCDGILAANPDFHFQDPGVNAMLAKSLDDLSYLDQAKLGEASEKARVEVSAYMMKKKEVFAQDVEANKKSAASLKERNKVLRASPVTEEDWKALDGAIQQQSTDLDAATPTGNTSLSDLSGLWAKMVMARDGNGLIKAKLDDVEKKIKDTEDKEPFVLKFLDEKNLAEKYDSGSKQWSYALGDPGFELRGTKMVTSFKNPDVQKLFESKVTPFINSLLDKKQFTADEKKQVDAIMAKADKSDKVKTQAAVAEATGYILARTEAKLSSDDLLNFQKIEQIMNQAMRDSTFSFDHRPTLEELKNTYTQKFIPAWEKAGKDFDAQVKPAPAPSGGGKGGAGGSKEQPTSVVGGGFLGGGGGKEKIPSSADPYLDRWAQGGPVPLPEGFLGYSGGLMVSRDIVDLKFRDPTTHRIALTVPGGTGASMNEISFSDPNAYAWRVDNRTYAKVTYQGKEYYAAMEYLLKNDIAPKGGKGGSPPPSQEQPPKGSKTPETVKEGDLAFLGTVNVEYRAALEKIWKDRNNPDGSNFVLGFNKNNLQCHLTKEQNQWKIYWNTVKDNRRSLSFNTLEEAMKGINNGTLSQYLTYETMRDENAYKPYQESVDKVDELKDVSGDKVGKYSVFLELDWHGGGATESGDPSITAKALPHGRISWSMDLDNCGPGGQNSRIGTAENFDDFMKQLAHIKVWDESYDSKKMTESKASREYLYAKISDPTTFRSREREIGHIVHYGIDKDTNVLMYLDWGGGASQDVTKNPRLNVWVNDNGKLGYTLNFRGKGLLKEGLLDNVDQLLDIVADAKKSV